MTDCNTLLNDEELDMLVVLRMNRGFIEWAQVKFSHLHRGNFKFSEIPAEENEAEYGL